MNEQPFREFLAAPTLEGLRGVTGDNLLLRVGALVGAGVITAGEARQLAGFRPRILEGLPDEWRATPPARLVGRAL